MGIWARYIFRGHLNSLSMVAQTVKNLPAMWETQKLFRVITEKELIRKV